MNSLVTEASKHDAGCSLLEHDFPRSRVADSGATNCPEVLLAGPGVLLAGSRLWNAATQECVACGQWLADHLAQLENSALAGSMWVSTAASAFWRILSLPQKTGRMFQVCAWPKLDAPVVCPSRAIKLSQVATDILHICNLEILQCGIQTTSARRYEITTGSPRYV